MPVFLPHVKVENSNIITPNDQTKMNLSNELSATVQRVYIFDDLATGSLILIVQLCDDDCLALFSKYSFKILKTNKFIITGKRNENG